jgi:hypothetical protein
LTGTAQPAFFGGHRSFFINNINNVQIYPPIWYRTVNLAIPGSWPIWWTGVPDTVDAENIDLARENRGGET